jgi:hypothetical protein
MKSIILLLTLGFLVASCGKKSSRSNTRNDSRDTGDSSTVRVEDYKLKLKCLEGNLGWLENPPMTKKEIFQRLTKASYVGCEADSVIVGIYTEQVLERYPNIQFKDLP